MSQGDVFLFLWDMDRHIYLLPELWVTLSDDERKRASRFKFENDRRRFIISRGTLREILGRLVGTAPAKIEFLYSENGKPFLTGQPHDKLICFNLAHSEKMALYAFARGLELGVDIERVRRMPDMENIVANFFSEGEKDLLAVLPFKDRVSLFFRLWTRKEALVKAIGDGISRPLSGVDVSPTPGKNMGHLTSTRYSGTKSDWSIYDLQTTRSFAAAMAVERGFHTVQWLNGHIFTLRKT